MLAHYYNENNPKIADWIRELIKQRLIADGEVDQRSIVEVQPGDLKGFTQVHWFAGICGWPIALQRAGWPADRPCWSASLPCQPFSVAGKQKGLKDDRHLWPVFHRLVQACRPETIIGEQVASAEVVGSQLEADFVIAVQSGDYARANKLAKRLVRSNKFHYHRRWIDGIQADLAEQGYTFGAQVLGAHSCGLPHIRQRLFWLAQRESVGRWGQHQESGTGSRWPGLEGSGADGRLADTHQLHGDGAGSGSSLQGREQQGPAELSGQSTAQRVGKPDRAGRGTGESPTAPPRHGCAVESAGSRGGGPGNPAGGGCGVVGDVAQPGDGGHPVSAGRAGSVAGGLWPDPQHDGGRADEPQRGSEGGTAEGRTGEGPNGPAAWDEFEIILCRDGKHRRIPLPLADIPSVVDEFSDVLDALRAKGCTEGEITEILSGFPLAHCPGRTLLLHGYGNSIVVETAAQFIRAFLSVLPDSSADD